MSDRVPVLIAELEDRLQYLSTSADAALRQDVVTDVRAALRELAELVSRRRWPRVVRGGLPESPQFVRLDDRELTALLADTQDAVGELQERVRFLEHQLLRCREHLHAATVLDPGAVEEAVQTLAAGGLTAEQSVALAVLRGAAGGGQPFPPPDTGLPAG